MVTARTCSEPCGLTDVWALTPRLGRLLSEEHTDLGVLPRADGIGKMQDHNCAFILSSRLVYLHVDKVLVSTSSSPPKHPLNGRPFENEPLLGRQGVC